MKSAPRDACIFPTLILIALKNTFPLSACIRVQVPLKISGITHLWKIQETVKKQGKKQSSAWRFTENNHGYFLRFLNCTNGPKSRKASHM